VKLHIITGTAMPACMHVADDKYYTVVKYAVLFMWLWLFFIVCKTEGEI